MKVELITLHSVRNYGSVLQAYATQNIFKKYGLTVEIIDFRRKWEYGIGQFFFLHEKTLNGLMKGIILLPTKVKQYKVFAAYMKSKLNLSKRMYKSQEDFSRFPLEADIFCTGSDQVWNSGWNKGIISEYFLSFVENGKKISYAASIGNDEIQADDVEVIRQYLLDYEHISVREKSAKKALAKIGIDNAEVVLDPTLQYTKEEWLREVEKCTSNYRDYVLLIQLNRNKKFDDFAVEFAQKRNKRLLRLCLRYDQMRLPGEHVVLPAVENYISLIANADYVLTDSFHAISFCLNFERQFYCVLPDKYSSRLGSILQLTNLESRIVHGYYLKEEQMIDINYSEVTSKINVYRESSRKYIEKALGM